MLYLIPRVKVNYTFRDLMRALFVSERRYCARKECEKILSQFFGVESICLVPSGRCAIYELLVRLPQQKVVIPAYTCMAVVESVLLAKKDVVYCKTDSRSYNSNYIDCISANCIVLATHQYGMPCNIEEIANKCKEVGAVLVEDCATSMGTIVNGKRTGTFGDYAIVSFNSSKLINVPPSGGVLVGRNKEMIDEIKRNENWDTGNLLFKCKAIMKGLAYVVTKNRIVYKMYHYIKIDAKGKLQNTVHEKPIEQKNEMYSYRFSEWQATILLPQLKMLDCLMDKRKKIYAYYDRAIQNALIQKPIVDVNAVCCRYTIQVKKREDFYKKCVKKGVDMDFSHCFLACPESFKMEHMMAQKILNLPFYYDLSKKELEKIILVVNAIR